MLRKILAIACLLSTLWVLIFYSAVDRENISFLIDAVTMLTFESLFFVFLIMNIIIEIKAKKLLVVLINTFFILCLFTNMLTYLFNFQLSTIFYYTWELSSLVFLGVYTTVLLTKSD